METYGDGASGGWDVEEFAMAAVSGIHGGEFDGVCG
jgi:hypothetical protein